MNTQISVIRRLLPCALLACSLLAALPSTAQTQIEVEEKDGKQPAGANALGPNLSCETLVVVISGSSAALTNVSCNHGYSRTVLPVDGAVASGKPAILVLQQSAAYGPDCTITVRGGGNTAVLKAQQNFCGFAAGDVTASVSSGRATLNGTARGGYPSTPGIVWFTVGF